MVTTGTGDDFPRILRFSSFDQPPALATQQLGSPISSEFCDAFELATGWSVAFSESKPSRNRRRRPGLADSPVTGTLSIDDMSADWPDGSAVVHRGKCDQLVACIDSLVSELQQSRLKMYAAQAELAANGPVVVSPEESCRFAEQLASLLNTAAESVGLGTAAIYLLDDDAQWLRMRSSVGLNGKHIKFDQRLLATSLADIEAMAGNAIVVTDPTQGRIWNMPEDRHCGVCIPVASSATILGTLWIFGDKARDFSDSQINILEIIAGRIASELEREAMIRQSLRLRSQRESRSTRIENHPVIDPPFDGWTMEGNVGRDGHRFIEWGVTEDEEIRITIGRSLADGRDGHNASLFVDPLTGEFQVHGRVEGVSFWMLDRKTGVVFDIDEWSRPLPLASGQSIVAVTTGNQKLARQRLTDFEQGRQYDGLVLYLNRI